MTARRLAHIQGFSIDRVAAAADSDPAVLRLENLDTDLSPPTAAITATRAALDTDDVNSYLPFTGRAALRQAIAARIARTAGQPIDPEHIVVTAGGTEAMIDALLATTDPGDEVVVTDPTYAGMIGRVRLAGCTPRFAPFIERDRAWRLDLDALAAAVSDRTTALFLMNPAMPSGAVLDDEEWRTIARLCREHDLWLLYNAAMERIVFDGRAVVHPLSLPGMAERTVTLGSISKEYRMIGWRIGWLHAPPGLVADAAMVHIYNVVTPPGIAQPGAIAALGEPETSFAACLETWQRRRDVVAGELAAFDSIPAAGGWSQLVDVATHGHEPVDASARLLTEGVAATPMTGWGETRAARFVRVVFSNEPCARLRGLGARFARALEVA